MSPLVTRLAGFTVTARRAMKEVIANVLCALIVSAVIVGLIAGAIVKRKGSKENG